MGYRSKVIIGVKKEHSSRLEELLTEIEILEYMDIEEKNLNRLFINPWKVYTIEEMKWYSDCEKVNSYIREILNKHDDNAFIVCLGSDDGEIHDAQGYWYDYVDHSYDINLNEY
tara:strand:+ start:122 stop:463 length:342 start_codon:yes stop_codon:yes gene_type:complete